MKQLFKTVPSGACWPFQGRFLLAGLCFFAFAESRANENEVEPVVLQLKWTHQFQFAGYYMAKHKGYYREADLEVEIREGSPTMDVTEQVLSGKADFGVGTSSLLLDYAAGKPVVVLGVVYQHSPLVLIMRANKPSDTLERLQGDPIMLEAHSGDLLAMLRRKGLPLDQLNITNRPCHAEKRLEHNPGAISAYLTDEPYTLDQMGVDYFISSPRSYGIDFYGDNFFTTQQMVKNKKGVVKRFRAATLRGWEEALSNPEEAIDLILKEYPCKKTREHLLYEARITQDLMTKLVTPGYMCSARWQHIAETYLETGLLEKTPDLGGFIFKTRPYTLPKWFWTSTLGAASLILLLVSISIYLRILNVRLGREIAKRRSAEQHLKTTNRELQQAKEIAEETSRQKSRFIANVSHDLRSPISAFISLSHILRHHSESLDLPDQFIRFLDQLNAGSKFLMLMINNLIDFSTFEMDEAIVRPENMDLDDWCGNIANLSQPQANERGVEIKMRVSPPGSTIEADHTRLSQILMNLLHNAIRFSPRGGVVTVEISIQAGVLAMDVRDQGPSIRLEERKLIFDLVAQKEKSLSQRKGTGLGLSIVPRNTQLLDGSIQVEQAEPAGARFIVTIPLEQTH